MANKKLLNRMTLIEKIKALTPGGQFSVEAESERVMAVQAGKDLRMAGIIEFTVTSRKNPDNGTYTIFALK